MRWTHLWVGIAVLGTWPLASEAQAQANPQVQSLAESDVRALTYSDYMSLGYNAQQEGRYREAVQYFRNALYLNPEDRSAVIAYWNAWDQLSQNPSDRAMAFDTYMNRGYDATDAGSYNVALENFQQALDLRPGNYYATQAIRNVRTYLNSAVVVGGEQQPNAFPTLPGNVIEDVPQGFQGELPYDRYMRLGYAALEEENFITAANYFRSALYERPNDRRATIAYWNAVDGSRDGEAGLGDETATESRYDQLMRLGYDATQREEYQMALQFFQQALVERPNDYYASEAIDNVTTYIAN